VAILRHIVTAVSCRKYHVWAEKSSADDRIRKNERWKATRPPAVTTCEHLLLRREVMFCRLDEGENEASFRQGTICLESDIIEQQWPERNQQLSAGIVEPENNEQVEFNSDERVFVPMQIESDVLFTPHPRHEDCDSCETYSSEEGNYDPLKFEGGSVYESDSDSENFGGAQNIREDTSFESSALGTIHASPVASEITKMEEPAKHITVGCEVPPTVHQGSGKAHYCWL